MRADVGGALDLPKENVFVMRLKSNPKEPIELEIHVKTKNIKVSTESLRSQSTNLDSKLLNGKHTSKLDSIEIFHQDESTVKNNAEDPNQSTNKNDEKTKDPESLKSENENLLKIVEEMHKQQQANEELNKNMAKLLAKTQSIEDQIHKDGRQ
jgi:hypothetical protein